MRFVELVRVSGASQASRDTPADQRAALDRLRLSRPGVFVERIEEGAAGLSGALPLSERPDLLRLQALAQARAFDEVRVRHLDRLTRHTDHLERAYVFSMVARAGAVMVEASGAELDPSTLAGELTWVVRSIASADERLKISERTSEARKRLAKEGKLQGRAPFARRWDKVTGEWGTDAAEMRVYRRIFSEALAGRSLQGIARRLTAEKVAKPQGPLPWSAGNVRHLLRARGAIGEITSQGFPLRCPPVVDRETWEHANALVRESFRSGRPPLDPALALLRGVAVCGVCGAPIWVIRSQARGKPYRYYVCRWRRTARNAECRRHYRVEAIDEKARQALLDGLASDVAPEAGKETREDPAALLKRAEAVLRALDVEERRLLGVLRKTAHPENVEVALSEIGVEREAARREVEAARLLVEKPPPVHVDHKARAAMLRRARVASASELRALVLAALRPGDAVLLPGGEVQLRSGALGPRATGRQP